MSAKLATLAAVVCLVCAAIFNAPVNDEFGHFFAGLCYWQTGDTATFNVNPPLVRALATWPAFVSGMRVQTPPPNSYALRTEFKSGRELFMAEPERFQRFLIIGRLHVALITLAAAGVLYHWATALAGYQAGWLAAGLWLCQPQILAHGTLITGDVVCAAAVIVAVRCLLWTFEQLTVRRALTLGLAVAAAVLTKFTALVLLPIVVLAFAWNADRYSLRRLAVCLTLTCLMFMATIALPYRFEGWGKNLLEYQFLSATFHDLQQHIAGVANLGTAQALFALPVPVPEQLLLGMDRQQLDFEHGLPSYAAGYRGIHGWWWFYLYSMAVKMPLGTLLCVAAAGVALAGGRNQMAVGLAWPLLTLAALIVATCLQDGFAQQHRYILPAYPLLFLIIGVVAARTFASVQSLLGVPLKYFERTILLGFALSVAGCISAAPNWLSAFNGLAGGNTSGFKRLFNDASDWGQDTYRVRDWINAHQDGTPIYVQSSISGIREIRAVGAEEFEDFGGIVEQLRKPCWLVVSKSDYVMHTPFEEQFDPLPVHQYLGGTHVVYRLLPDTAPANGGAP